MTACIVLGLLATPASGATSSIPMSAGVAPETYDLRTHEAGRSLGGLADGSDPSQSRRAHSSESVRFGAPSASTARCSYTRHRALMGAVQFYSSRLSEWLGLDKAGASRASVAPHGSRCPLYLAKRLRARAYAARLVYGRWLESRAREYELAADRLDRGLASSPMAGTGESLEHWGRIYHVSPYFMAAAAATESSLGAAACSNNRFNVWGLSSCGSGWYVPAFSSWDEAIHFYARFLSSRWPGHSTPYSFHGYAACSECWGRKVSEWMRSLFGVPAGTRYP